MDPYVSLGQGETPCTLKDRRRTSRVRQSMAAAGAKRAIAPAEPKGSAFTFDFAQSGLDGLSEFVHKVSFSFWLSMVLGGFVAPRGGRMANRVWQLLFLGAFTICGSACLLNCYIRDPPFHMLPADMMVSLVHVPGFYSIFFWRDILSSPTSPIWSVLLGSNEQMPRLKAAARHRAPLLLPAQLATVVLVLVGYSVPAQLFVNEIDASVASTGGDPHMLTKMHNYSMWIVIPPVVSCVVANAALFSFFVYSMYLQVDLALEAMTSKERACLETDGDVGVGKALLSVLEKELEKEHSEECEESVVQSPSMKVLGDYDYERLIELVAEDVFALQDMIDDVCEAWSSLVLLFIVIAFAELLAVLLDLIEVYQRQATFELTAWVYCIDAFLAASGLGIFLGFLVMGAVLTQRMDELCIESVQVMRAAKVPISKAAGAFSYLQTGGRKSGLGFKIYDSRIEWSHVYGFVSVVFTIIGFVMNGGSGGSPHEGDGRRLRGR